MALGDRLGLAGLVMALIGIAVAILWPDNKWIGWISFSAALILAVAWAWMEGRPYATAWYRSSPIVSTIIVFFCGGLLAGGAWVVFLKGDSAVPPKQEEKIAPHPPYA